MVFRLIVETRLSVTSNDFGVALTSPKPWWSKSAASTQGLIPRSASMIPGSVCGSASLPGSTVPPPTLRSTSPKLFEVIDPPTNSSATGLPSPPCVRTSPAMNVWMSPVTNTTSRIFLRSMWLSSSSRSRG